MPRHVPLAAVLLVVIALATGCSRYVAGDDVEARLAETLSQFRGEVDIVCPDDLKGEVGEQITCTITIPDGSELEATATVDGVEGERIHYTFDFGEQFGNLGPAQAP